MFQIGPETPHWGSCQFNIQWNPGNSNYEGKRKIVRVSGVSSYWGRLNIQFAQFIIDSLSIFQHFSTENSVN